MGGGQVTIFRLLDILPKITDGTNGERYTLFRGVCHTLTPPSKEKEEGLQISIFRHLYIPPKITDGTNGEMYTLFRGVCHTLNPKNKKIKKGGLKSKAPAGSQGTIFRL